MPAVVTSAPARPPRASPAHSLRSCAPPSILERGVRLSLLPPLDSREGWKRFILVDAERD